MRQVLEHARSFLFVPATRLDRLIKAFNSGAEAVVVDLEDAVDPASKETARVALAQSLSHLECDQLTRLVVRINAVDTPWHQADLIAMTPIFSQGQGAVMLPKTEVPETIQQVAAQLGPNGWVLPLIESLAGLDAVNSLVRESRVLRLAFGHLDFQLDLGMKCHPDEPELDGVRFALVAASRRACLPAPIDSITADIGNAERLAFDSARASAFGFGGKLCIHPSQANIVNQSFLPSAGEVNWARKVLDMAARTGAEAFSLDGRMVDKPVIRMAEKILSSAACDLPDFSDQSLLKTLASVDKPV